MFTSMENASRVHHSRTNYLRQLLTLQHPLTSEKVCIACRCCARMERSGMSCAGGVTNGNGRVILTYWRVVSIAIPPALILEYNVPMVKLAKWADEMNGETLPPLPWTKLVYSGQWKAFTATHRMLVPVLWVLIHQRKGPNGWSSISQAELKRLTGLSKPTISNSMKTLVEEGVFNRQVNTGCVPARFRLNAQWWSRVGLPAPQVGLFHE